MDNIELGKMLFGKTNQAPLANPSGGLKINGTTTLIGTAVSNSKNGSVSVNISGEILEIPTTFAVKERDEVIITLSNHSPVVTGVIGQGDELYGHISTVQDEIKDVEEQAQTAANAAAKANSAADAALTAAGLAAEAVSKVKSEVDTVIEDATALRKDITADLEAITTTMKTDYATKTEVADTKTTLETAITETAAGLKTEVSQTYAKQTDLTSVQAQLEAQLEINADAIKSSVSSIEKIKVDADATKEMAEAAAAAAKTAKDNAATAQSAANAAQSAADTAQSEYNDLAARTDVTEDELATAKTAVDAAKKSAEEAASVASIAQTAANLANESLKILEPRVTEAESSILQLSEKIVSQVKVTDGLGQRVSSVEQTADGLSVELKQISDATTNAAKTATNFLEYTSAGLSVGNKSSGGWIGYRTRMTASAFQVLDAAGAVLASYGAKLVELGKTATDAAISLCGGSVTISGSTKKNDWGSGASITSNSNIYVGKHRNNGTEDNSDAYLQETISSAGVATLNLIATRNNQGSINHNAKIYITAGGTAAEAGITATNIRLNGTIYISSALLADFVVAQGTSGTWTYRKWNSGNAECWEYRELGSYNISTKYGNLYYKDMPTKGFPFTFKSIKNIQLTVWSGSGLIGASVKTLTNTGYSAYIYSASSISITPAIMCHVSGRWK